MTFRLHSLQIYFFGFQQSLEVIRSIEALETYVGIDPRLTRRMHPAARIRILEDLCESLRDSETRVFGTTHVTLAECIDLAINDVRNVVLTMELARTS